MSNLNRGIPISTGFALNARMPLDTRTVVQTKMDLISMPDINKYVGMYVYIAEDNIQVRLREDGIYEVDHTGFIKGSGIPDASIGNGGDMYINDSGEGKGDVYFKSIINQSTLETGWTYALNIIGPKGDQGTKGPTGTRGTIWFSGDKITGDSTDPTVFPFSEIPNCLAGDMYFAFSGNIYQCTKGGSETIAEWVYVTSIIGPQGIQGVPGLQGIQGIQGLQGIQGVKGDNGSIIYSGSQLYGDTSYTTESGEIIDGKVFSTASADGNEYLAGDYYLSLLGGEFYKAKNPGLIFEVTWIKVSGIGGNKVYAGTTISGIGDSIAPYIEYDENGEPIEGDIIFAIANDLYLNMPEGSLYKCIVPGKPENCRWKYIGYIPTRASKDNNGQNILDYVYNVQASAVDKLVITKGSGETTEIQLQGASYNFEIEMITGSASWEQYTNTNGDIWYKYKTLISLFESSDEYNNYSISIYPTDDEATLQGIFEYDITAELELQEEHYENGDIKSFSAYMVFISHTGINPGNCDHYYEITAYKKLPN